MFLAKVIGRVVSTQKNQNLVGAKLLLVRSIDEKGNSIKDNVFVAVDTVGAGSGEIVLIDWGSSAYEDIRISSDMAIVGIIDSVEIDIE
ncbi:EutN/CcmL family microcompartment protein [Clostridium formicaceticum]|uniref:Carbon dioxide concentrating mechanism protein CcmL n=1 Tax=Clostridium formicaceticum TaxID=1497 RepID=A0AAC9RL21_9CLOT|nr:EutN/CcmL family microcompartment protein [Clostridium formicaceticum]AOY77124.1 ethanolamine utilization protein EutN [Clostridium formicaceticum]ARE87639.1 Carbon dioxide concentrating mechanism protein CcmL [Clostridium formicaceticum]